MTHYELNLPTPIGALPIIVELKRVRNFNLRVRADGSVHLSMPLHARLSDAEDFLMRRRDWIASHVQAHRERARVASTAENDGRIPLWGELVALDEALARAGLAQTMGAKTQAADRAAKEAEGAASAESGATSTQALALDADRATALQALYRREMLRVLPAHTEPLEERLGVRAAHWQVRHMTSRWGSCTPARRTIRISSTLVAYPPACLDFVITHELVHLMEPSHNRRFHMLLDCYCPENRALAALLRTNARTVAMGQAHT